MITTTETFTQDSQPHCNFVERIEGGLRYQTTTYLAGPRAGTTELSVELVVPSGDIEHLIAAHRELCSRPGFHDANNGGEAAARAFLAQTGGRGCLHANNR